MLMVMAHSKGPGEVGRVSIPSMLRRGQGSSTTAQPAFTCFIHFSPLNGDSSSHRTDESTKELAQGHMLTAIFQPCPILFQLLSNPSWSSLSPTSP